MSLLSRPDLERWGRLTSLNVKLCDNVMYHVIVCMCDVCTCRVLLRRCQSAIAQLNWIIIIAKPSVTTEHPLLLKTTHSLNTLCITQYRIVGKFRGVQFSRFSWVRQSEPTKIEFHASALKQPCVTSTHVLLNVNFSPLRNYQMKPSLSLHVILHPRIFLTVR